MSRPRVLLGMSGGIDSTVSAMLLLEQGYEVVGVTFRTFDSIRESCLAREKGCCSIDSIMEAKNNARKMGFEHHIVDFRDTFRRCVIDNFINEYMHGRTPNPCVLCNSHIKWGEMLRFADEQGCDFIATGHYARIVERDGHTYLGCAADQKKDQTYFLWMLGEHQLRRTIFPLGNLTKAEVRDIARQHGYPALAEKKESQEICFVTDNDYRSFLRENVPDYDRIVLHGHYIDAQGRILGEHEGYPNYTIGQRKGLGIALGKPAYVTAIRPETNEVVLGDNDDLLTRFAQITVRPGHEPRPLTNAYAPLFARVRYRSQPVEVSNVESLTECHPQQDGLVGSNLPLNSFRVEFRSPVWGITPGQSLVLYQDNLVIGGGIISSPNSPYLETPPLS